METHSNSMRKILCLATLFTILSCTSVSLWGQETGGTINGTLKDASGAVILGAKATITNLATGRAVTVNTGGDGMYMARNLEPGRYSVRFDMSGFTPVAMENVNLLLGQILKVDAALEVAPVSETITAIETVPLIDLSSTTIGHNVTAEEFDRLPKARSFQGIFLTSPSVSSGLDQYGNIVGIEGGFQVNGSSSAENQFN